MTSNRIDHARALELIEQAEHDLPLCECGQHTLAVARAGGVWQQCSTLQQPRSTLWRLVTFDFAASHVDRQIVDLNSLRAA